MLRKTCCKKLYSEIEEEYSPVEGAPNTKGEDHDEHQYLNLIYDILKHGVEENGRNGMTKSVFGASMHFSLEGGVVPVLTTKAVAWRTCLKELLWFIHGDTNNEHLTSVGVHIWDDNASREFLDSRGLHERAEGDLGPIYGHQWRHFNAAYTTCHADYAGKGVDQLQGIIDALKDPSQRTSRRLIMSAWNPCQLDEMALPPCHVMVQFNVMEGRYLSCALYQRSGDVGLGVPFNIASYSFLTHLLAKHCGLEAREFVYHLGNAHIYDDHYDGLSQQLKRRPFAFPRLNIHGEVHKDINNYRAEDFVLRDYRSYSAIKMKMRK